MMAPKQGTERIGRRLKLRDLRILMTVVECGTMGKAAERLAISQPVVSKAIADMEHALGVRLLDRSQRGVEPTPYGRALVKRGFAIFDEMRQGLEEIEFLSDPTAGEVRIGATDAINAAIVAPVIDRLSRQYPRMTFHVVAGIPAPLRQELAARNVDFVISRFARPGGEEYSEEILFHDALVAVAGPKNPLARRRKVELAELLGEPWVLDPLSTDLGAMQAGLFRAAGLEPPRLTVAAPSIALRDELLATGRFLTVVVGFSLLLPHKHPGLKALPVKLHDNRQPVGITTLEESVAQPGRANVHRVRPRIGETRLRTDDSQVFAPLHWVWKRPITTVARHLPTESRHGLLHRVGNGTFWRRSVLSSRPAARGAKRPFAWRSIDARAWMKHQFKG